MTDTTQTPPGELAPTNPPPEHTGARPAVPTPPRVPRDAHLGMCEPPPAHRRRWRNALWICPRCGQAWTTTRRQPHNIAPTVLSWWWRKWPLEEGY